MNLIRATPLSNFACRIHKLEVLLKELDARAGTQERTVFIYFCSEDYLKQQNGLPAQGEINMFITAAEKLISFFQTESGQIPPSKQWEENKKALIDYLLYHGLLLGSYRKLPNDEQNAVKEELNKLQRPMKALLDEIQEEKNKLYKKLWKEK